MKRLSGTYVASLIYLGLPLAFIAGIVLSFFMDTTMAIRAVGAALLAFWALDSLLMRIRFHPKPFVAENGQIRYGDRYLAYSQITSIALVSGRYLPFLRWYYTLIKIQLGPSEAVYAIPKSMFFGDWIHGNFNPAAGAIWSVPELRDKLIISDRIKKKLRKKYASGEIDELNGNEK